jgi:hypothetical protein
MRSYFRRVFHRTFIEWHPKMTSVALTITALTLATLLAPRATGAGNLDWTKWRATVEAWGIVLGGLLLLKHFGSYWTINQESEARIRDLKVVVVNLSRKLPQLARVHLLLGQVSEMYNELIQLSKTSNMPKCPLGYNTVPFVTDKDRWDQSMVRVAVFQGRFKLLSALVASAGLVVKDPIPPNDTRSLCGFPYEAEYVDVLKNMESYLAALRAYAASLEDNGSLSS